MPKARAELQRLEREYALEVDPDAVVGDLAVGLQQRVEILKALYRGADTLILDEPTGVLTPDEADHLFRILRQLREQGKTIVLITHKLREIMAVTDSVSVMRRGEIVATRRTAETSPEELAQLMVGRRVLLRVEKKPVVPGPPLLKVENLGYVDGQKVTRLADVSFEVRAGEIVGIAGVAGNGQSELLEVLAGIRKATVGKVWLHGEPVPVMTEADPAALRARGLAHVPEDRHRMGLVNAFEEWENSALGYHGSPDFLDGPLLDISAMRDDARRKIEQYDIRPPSCRLKTANFSGGNQQKIVLARELERGPFRPAGGPADARRRYWRDRIHPAPVAGDARGRQGHPARFRRAGRGARLVRPHPRHVRRPRRRRAHDRVGRARAGPVDGRHGRGRLAGMTASASPSQPSPVSAGRAPATLPAWADYIVLPMINVVAAFFVSGLVVLMIGENPLRAVQILTWGALGFGEGVGFTLYYATNFILTGLAVAVAFHAGLFNIGGEGQAYLGGLGVALAALALDRVLPWYLLFPVAIAGAALFGAAWAFCRPGCRRASAATSSSPPSCSTSSPRR
jgi:ABC-type multidrug transport system ATPase subunit